MQIGYLGPARGPDGRASRRRARPTAAHPAGLASEVAGEWVDRRRDGVWFVPLAPVADPGGLPLAVLDALGVREVALLDQRAELPRQDARDRLLAQLADSDALLALDDCKHLVAATADLVAELLGRCPGVWGCWPPAASPSARTGSGCTPSRRSPYPVTTVGG